MNTPDGDQSSPVDTARAHSARVQNYWLGSKDHFAADREIGDQIRAIHPGIAQQARAERIFGRRAVRHLVRAHGVDQFLDIGVGYPAEDNTHHIAQRINPTARIVYVDNDPVVLTHTRALLTPTPEGTCTFLDADLHDPETIIAGARASLDFAQPIAVLLVSVLHHITDTTQARSIIRTLTAVLPVGSYLAICHATDTVHGGRSNYATYWNTHATPPISLRSPGQITGFFDGLELLPPGMVSCSQWIPAAATPTIHAAPVDAFCGLGEKVTP